MHAVTAKAGAGGLRLDSSLGGFGNPSASGTLSVDVV
jgi:hypothetical protein